MGDRLCDGCGFYFIDGDIEKCHISKESIDSAVGYGKCKTFIARQYDGSEPFTPEEHEWLLRDGLEKKKMKNTQGLRFR